MLLEYHLLKPGHVVIKPVSEKEVEGFELMCISGDFLVE